MKITAIQAQFGASALIRVRDMRDALHGVPNALTPNSDPEQSSGTGNAEVLWDPDQDDSPTIAVDHGADSSELDAGLMPIVEFAPEIENDRATPLLDPRTFGGIKARAMTLGVEALAWYKPFHHTGHQWGIYLSYSGLAYLADMMLPLNLTLQRRMLFAVHGLLRHEAIHFAVEHMVGQWELASDAACYLGARSKLRNERVGYYELEEALADAYFLRGFRYPTSDLRQSGAFSAMRAFTKEQPAGYNRAEEYVTRPQFEEGMGHVAWDYIGTASGHQPHPLGFDYTNFYANLNSVDCRCVPVFLVNEKNVAVLPTIVLRFIPKLTEIAESDDVLKRLTSLGTDVQRAWHRTKTKLSQSTEANGLDFRPWRKNKSKDVFSVRVTDNVRAHLRLDTSTGRWLAIAIGNHGEMGHG